MGVGERETPPEVTKTYEKEENGEEREGYVIIVSMYVVIVVLCGL